MQYIIICVVLIFVYGYFTRKTGVPDILERKLTKHEAISNLDGWSIAHLLFFGMLGYLDPGKHVEYLCIGIGWELIETVLGQKKLTVCGHRIQLMGDQAPSGVYTGNNDGYWYGRSTDIMYNSVGYIIGDALSEKKVKCNSAEQ